MNLRGSRASAPSWESWSFLFVLPLWAVTRILQLKYLGPGTGFDVGLYSQYAHQWGSGAGAYADFQPEYPPGALPIFLLPLLWDSPNYATAFAWEMACFDLLAACIVWRSCQIGARRGPWRPLGALVVYLLTTAALHPVLYTRFDLVPGSLTLAAVYFLRQRRVPLASLLLGVAGCVKLWPFALFPLFAGWELRRRGVRHAVSATFWVTAGAVLAASPVLPRAGFAVLGFLKYHALRGIQIETTWATISMFLGRIGVATVQPEHNFGAFHVAGRLPTLLAALSMPLTVLFAFAPQVLALSRRLRSDADEDRTLVHAAFTTSVGFMIAGKVLSPQFMLWIAPLLPLVAEGVVGAIFVIAVGVLTTVVYPHLSPALEQREPGHGLALLAVGSRNLILIGWYWTFFVRFLWRPRLGLAPLANPPDLAAAPSREHGPV